MGQSDVVLTGDSEIGRQVDRIEQLAVEKRTDEEELQSEEETGYERFPLSEAPDNICRSDRGLASVSAATGR